MKKRTTVALALLSGLAIPALSQSQSTQYRLTEESSVKFECSGRQVTRPARGRFATVGGRLSLSPQNPAEATGSVDVTLASINTDDAAWDQMFREAPFLDIPEFPRARFDLIRIDEARPFTTAGVNRARLVGRFTLHGVTKPLTVPVEIQYAAAGGPPQPHPERIQVRGSFRIAWTDFGINVPEGSTRTYAGDGARVDVYLVYEQQTPVPTKATRRAIRR